ncbi:MAG: TetR family transcriptional regulator [Sphingomonadales bacterium]|nr:TetR family transcriptional regulator [Sphingomonadales bacterium]
MPAPARISRDAVLDEAIALLAERGLEEVTLRAIATRLGVEAPSLYRHVGGKPRLLAAMTLRLFRRQLDEIGERADWRDWLHAFGCKLWETQQIIPDCARLVLTTNFTRCELAAMTDWVAAPLAASGIPTDLALKAHLSVQALVLGLGSLADGPNADVLHQSVPFAAIFRDSLAALIEGWVVQVEGKHG